MRFLVLVTATAVGAVAVVSFKAFFPQQDALMRATVRAAANDVALFHLSDLNPLQWAYNRVASEIASPRPNAALNFQSAPVIVGEFKMPTAGGIDQLGLGGGLATRNGSLPHGHSAIVRCSRGGVTIPCD
jgi:hypothetical protein